MKRSKHFLSLAAFVGVLATHSFVASAQVEQLCRPALEKGNSLQVVVLREASDVACVYSDEAIESISGDFQPHMKQKHHWQKGYDDWYCEPVNGDAKLCSFTKVTD